MAAHTSRISTGSRSSGRVAMAYDYLCRKRLGSESDSEGRVQRRWVGAFVGGAFGVIDKTIRQLGAYIQSVKDANQRIEIIEPVLLVPATQSAGENSSSKTMHILETEKKKKKETRWRGGKYLTSVESG